MPGRGRPPKAPNKRRNAHVPIRGEWRSSESSGWQHGETPTAPDGLMPASIEAWNVWLAAWFAAHWTPDDLPGLRQLIRLYDQVERGEFQRAAELRLQMDTYGITPKGQQDRRWTRPQTDEVPSSQPPQRPDGASPYAHLRVVNE